MVNLVLYGDPRVVTGAFHVLNDLLEQYEFPMMSRELLLQSSRRNHYPKRVSGSIGIQCLHLKEVVVADAAHPRVAAFKQEALGLVGCFEICPECSKILDGIEHTAACRNGDRGGYHVKQKIADMDFPNQPRKNPSSLIALVACLDTHAEIEKSFPFAKFTDPMWELPHSSGYYAVQRR